MEGTRISGEANEKGKEVGVVDMKGEGRHGDQEVGAEAVLGLSIQWRSLGVW